MPSPLIIDSSTLFAIEKAGLIELLPLLKRRVIIPKAVKVEIEEGKSAEVLRFVEVVELRGRSLKKSVSLQKLGIGKGEAECCSLASKLRLKFMVCDDRKFIRQRFFSSDKRLKSVKVLGFAFLLHLFHKKRLIQDVWPHFEKIIGLNNWERSEVQVSNYTFLKEMGH